VSRCFRLSRFASRFVPIFRCSTIKVADEIELPGVPPTIGYVSLNQYSIEQIADMLIKKLRS
jgi:hypothetical protein